MTIFAQRLGAGVPGASRAGAHTVFGLWCIALGFLPLLIPAYLLGEFTSIWAMGIFAMSLDLLIGYTGLFSLGHAAFLGAGSYTAGMLIAGYGITDFWVGTAASVIVATLIGALFGAVALRVRGAYFLLITFALAELLVVLGTTWDFLSPIGYGSVGITGIFLPSMAPFATPISAQTLYYIAAVAVVTCFVVLRGFLRTPLGLTLPGIRENESRMNALGYRPTISKYVVYVLAAACAGFAGALQVYHDGIATPSIFGVGTSTFVVLMVLIGGAGTLYGPIIGAGVIVLAEYFASGYLPQRWPLILGAIFVAAIMFARGGLAPLLARWAAALRPTRPLADLPGDIDPPAGRLADTVTSSRHRSDEDAAPEEMPYIPPGTELSVAHAVKHFGGVRAVDDISLTVGQGERVAIIGANGAGKSTAMSLIGGALDLDSGSISLGDVNITKLPTWQRAQLGIARSFQVNSLLPELSVYQNAWLAAQARATWRYEMIRPAHRHADAVTATETLLRAWSLWEYRDAAARHLAYGDQRRLEIVLALASSPRLLLLDEPTAGQSKADSLALADQLRDLGRDVSVLLIAHDLDLVYAVADRIIVFDRGRVIAEGTGAQIRADELVQQVYMTSGASLESGHGDE